MNPVLDIYVDQDCANCKTARLLAHEVRQRMPHVLVHLRELKPGDVPPEEVIAVPTYLLNGKRIALGNPSLSDLIRQLQA